MHVWFCFITQENGFDIGVVDSLGNCSSLYLHCCRQLYLQHGRLQPVSLTYFQFCAITLWRTLQKIRRWAFGEQGLNKKMQKKDWQMHMKYISCPGVGRVWWSMWLHSAWESSALCLASGPQLAFSKSTSERISQGRTRRCISNVSHFSVQRTSVWEICPGAAARRAQFSNSWDRSRGCFAELPRPPLPIRANHTSIKSGWVWCSTVVWCCHERRNLIRFDSVLLLKWPQVQVFQCSMFSPTVSFLFSTKFLANYMQCTWWTESIIFISSL